MEAARVLVEQGKHPAQQVSIASSWGWSTQHLRSLPANGWFCGTGRMSPRHAMNMERVVFPHGATRSPSGASAHVLDILRRADTNNGNSVMCEAKRTMSAIRACCLHTQRLLIRSYPSRPYCQQDPAQAAFIFRGGWRAAERGGRPWRLLPTSRVLHVADLARPSEVIEAEWCEFDLDQALWRIPAQRIANSCRRIPWIPLPPKAVACCAAYTRSPATEPIPLPLGRQKKVPMTARFADAEGLGLGRFNRMVTHHGQHGSMRWVSPQIDRTPTGPRWS